MSESTKEKNSEIGQIWNPSAAVNWSILFSPIFGAWIQAANWTEMGQLDKAKKSMKWVLGFICILILIFIPNPDINQLARLIGVIAFLVWYFKFARQQIRYVTKEGKKAYKDVNGVIYQKASYVMPVVVGFIVLAIIGYVTAPKENPSDNTEVKVSLIAQEPIEGQRELPLFR